MTKVKIWHNPRCTKSREGLEYLRAKHIDVEIIDYMKRGINAAELANAIAKSSQPLEEFIRTNERDFKLLGLEIEALTPESFAEIAAKHPRLLQRPIVVSDTKAVIGRPIERIQEVL